jgi:hypothetical protein
MNTQVRVVLGAVKRKCESDPEKAGLEESCLIPSIYSALIAILTSKTTRLNASFFMFLKNWRELKTGEARK